MSTGTHRHKKRFGQHFLVDTALVQSIVALIAPRKGERLVEIGPGDGALTAPLLAAAGSLTVIELDRDLLPRLHQLAGPGQQLQVVNADVLQVRLDTLPGEGPLRLVGNLPYNISSPILFHCLEQLDSIEDMHFMLQKEVVERMAAAPGGREYGRLSVMVQLVCEVEPLLDVPPAAFDPPPRVDSLVVRLAPRPADRRAADADGVLAEVVRAAFGQRRKTLANALRDLLDADGIRAAGIDPRQRAEQVPPDGFLALARQRRARIRTAR